MNRFLGSMVLMIIACSGVFAQDAGSSYATYCAHCHGIDGGGNTPLGRALKLRDLRSPEVKKLSENAVANIVAKGMDQGRMPGFEKKLGTEIVLKLAAYVQSIERQSPMPQVKTQARGIRNLRIVVCEVTQDCRRRFCPVSCADSPGGIR